MHRRVVGAFARPLGRSWPRGFLTHLCATQAPAQQAVLVLKYGRREPRALFVRDVCPQQVG
eukprot:4562944-Lingulodinium_polyedra.AAC.1